MLRYKPKSWNYIGSLPTVNLKTSKSKVAESEVSEKVFNILLALNY